MLKQKYYVVWKGKKTGVFDSWEECKKQVEGSTGSQYMSFSSKEAAIDAYKNDPENHIGKNAKQIYLPTKEQLKKYGNPIKKSISVDGAWNTATGKVEYQGVETESGKLLFHSGPYEDGTNNIVEFLAIVHALAYCKEKGLNTPIYSDSRNAISWVKDKQARTKLEKSPQNKELFNLLGRAILWLEGNTYTNKILKWETKVWGENPADFGRK